MIKTSIGGKFAQIYIDEFLKVLFAGLHIVSVVPGFLLEKPIVGRGTLFVQIDVTLLELKTRRANPTTLVCIRSEIATSGAVEKMETLESTGAKGERG